LIILSLLKYSKELNLSIGPPKEVKIMDINGNKLEGIIGPFDEYSSVVLVCEAING
jgi:sRNA-binding regulator protein Hfq